MTTIIADTDSLIKLTKAGLKESIIGNFEVIISPKVKEESVDHAEGKPDALIIEKNIAARKIKVGLTQHNDPVVEKEIHQLGLLKGEQDVYRLSLQIKHDLITSDDYKFLKMLHLLNKKVVTPASLLVLLYKRKKVGREEASRMLDHLQPYISMEEYELSRQEVL